MGPPPDGGQPPRFALAAAQDGAPPPQAPAAPADIEHNIRRPPADVHSRARRVKDAKRKNPPDIIDAGLPPKKPNRIAARGVPTVYPDAMKAVGDSERARRDGTWVPRSLSARPEGKPTSLMQPQPLAGVHPFTPTLTE